jgi:phage terminase large subunit GpA-like protein
MVKAEFLCNCGFTFEETFHESEVSKTEDFDRFYVRCPRCGEEASLGSWGRIAEKGDRQGRDFS